MARHALRRRRDSVTRAHARARDVAARRRSASDVHEGPEIPGVFDSFRVVETYRRTAEERGGHVPDAYEWAHEIAGRIERRRADDGRFRATTIS